MRSKAWLAVRVSLRLARLPRTASSALRSTRAAAPVLLAHADVTKNIILYSMGPKLRHPAVCLQESALGGKPARPVDRPREADPLAACLLKEKLTKRDSAVVTARHSRFGAQFAVLSAPKYVA